MQIHNELEEIILELRDCLCATKVTSVENEPDRLFVISNVSRGRLPQPGEKIKDTSDIKVMNGVFSIWVDDGTWNVQDSNGQTRPIERFDDRCEAVNYVKLAIEDYWSNKSVQFV